MNSVKRMIMKNKIETFLDLYLEDYSFDDILEMFDVTPLECFYTMFEEGLIDEELLDEYINGPNDNYD